MGERQWHAVRDPSSVETYFGGCRISYWIGLNLHCGDCCYVQSSLPCVIWVDKEQRRIPRRRTASIAFETPVAKEAKCRVGC